MDVHSYLEKEHISLKKGVIVDTTQKKYLTKIPFRKCHLNYFINTLYETCLYHLKWYAFYRLHCFIY